MVSCSVTMPFLLVLWMLPSAASLHYQGSTTATPATTVTTTTTGKHCTCSVGVRDKDDGSNVLMKTRPCTLLDTFSNMVDCQQACQKYDGGKPGEDWHHDEVTNGEPVPSLKNGECSIASSDTQLTKDWLETHVCSNSCTQKER